MREYFRDVKKGDPIRASDQTRINKALTDLEAQGPATGQQSIDIGGVRGTAAKSLGVIMVRMTRDAIPEWSAQFTDQIEPDLPMGPDDFNCILQVWDTLTKKWADDPGNTQFYVVPPDDQRGWMPLVKDAIIPIFWHKITNRYVALEPRESAVVSITGIKNADGLYPAVVMLWDSDNKMWIPQNDCWVLDS